MEGNSVFWKFVEEVHSSVGQHLEGDQQQTSLADASEWATDIAELLVSPSVYQVCGTGGRAEGGPADGGSSSLRFVMWSCAPR